MSKAEQIIEVLNEAAVDKFTSEEARAYIRAVEQWIEGHSLQRDKAFVVLKQFMDRIPKTQRTGGKLYRGYHFSTDQFETAKQVLKGTHKTDVFTSWTMNEDIAASFARGDMGGKQLQLLTTISIMAEADVSPSDVVINFTKFCKSKLRTQLSKHGRRPLFKRAVEMCRDEEEVLTDPKVLKKAKFSIAMRRVLPDGKKPFFAGGNKKLIDPKEFMKLSQDEFVELMNTPYDASKA